MSGGTQKVTQTLINSILHIVSLGPRIHMARLNNDFLCLLFHFLLSFTAYRFSRSYRLKVKIKSLEYLIWINKYSLH